MHTMTKQNSKYNDWLVTSRCIFKVFNIFRSTGSCTTHTQKTLLVTSILLKLSFVLFFNAFETFLNERAASKMVFFFVFFIIFGYGYFKSDKHEYLLQLYYTLDIWSCADKEYNTDVDFNIKYVCCWKEYPLYWITIFEIEARMTQENVRKKSAAHASTTRITNILQTLCTRSSSSF